MSGVRQRGDDGVTLPLVALSMVLLLIFSAFAVDLGLTYNYRRQDQGSVDAAAISAALEALNHQGSPEVTELVFDEVVRISHENSITGQDLDGWRSLWLECSDPGIGPGTDYPITLGTSAGKVDCIGFDAFPPSRMRVKLPDHEVPAVFAGIIGSQLMSSAVAEVEIRAQAGFGNVLPFAIAASTADGSYNCLFSGQGAHVPEGCSGPAQGQWGVLSSPRPTDSWCNLAGGSSQPFAENTAMGGDHALAVRADDPERLDRCPPEGVVPAQAANRMVRSVGVTPQNLKNGLITGVNFSDGMDARLTRNPWNVRHGVWGASVDDTPLWWFIPGPGEVNVKGVGADLATQIPAVCHRSTYATFANRSALLASLQSQVGIVGYAAADADRELLADWFEAQAWTNGYPMNLARKQHMDACFEHYNQGRWHPSHPAAGVTYTTDLFDLVDDEDDYRILTNPRFAWIPEADIVEFAGCNGGINCRFDIRRFRPIYLQSVTGGQARVWHAGEPFQNADGSPTGGLGANPFGLLSYTFNLSMLPQEVMDAGPVDPTGDRGVGLVR